MNIKTIVKWNDKFRKIKTEIPKADFVYTYVDSSSEKWKETYKKEFPEEDINTLRYQNYEEIYFSFKTVEKYGKSVCNNIYVVTADQKLDDSKLTPWIKERLSYVSHRDIIPPEYLPTFNSITIESFLHLIPNLTDNFIYFNDDVFLGNTLTNDFLYNNGILNVLVMINNRKRTKKDPNRPWEHYYFNADDLIKKRFNLNPNIVPTHTILMMNKNVCSITWILFGKELSSSITSKRNSKNINFWYLSYLVGLYLGYFKYKVPNQKQSYVMYCERVGNVNMAKRVMGEVKTLFNNRPTVFCYNNLTDVCKIVWDFIREKYLLLD